MDTAPKFSKAVGTVIARRRKAMLPQSMKQEKLARAVKLTRTSISNIELGRQRVLLDTFCGIAQALGATPTELLEEAFAEQTTTRSSVSHESTDKVEEYLIQEIIKGGGNAK